MLNFTCRVKKSCTHLWHVKDIGGHEKGQLVLMMWQVVEAKGSWCLNLCVSVFGLGHPDTLVSHQDGSVGGHGARNRLIHQGRHLWVSSIPECSGAAATLALAAMMCSRWTRTYVDACFALSHVQAFSSSILFHNCRNVPKHIHHT